MQETLHIKRNEAALNIGVVSDTHGYIDPRILEHLEHCDLILHAGDIGDASILSMLAEKGRVVYAVSGNNDNSAKWPQEQLKTLRSLPDNLVLDINNRRIQLLHGHQINPAKRRHEKLRDHYPDAKLIVYGHSHHLCCETAATPWILNPGAAGKARTYGGASCAVVEINKDRWSIQSFRVNV